MNNIYDECIDNSKVIYKEENDKTFSETFDRYKELYESKGYKVVFVDTNDDFLNSARIVLYAKDQHIPLHMQDFKGKWVNVNGKWIREGLLGICDRCGNYTELICLCDKGNLCEKLS